MAEGTKTYHGMAVPLAGESEIVAKNDTPDILTITGYTTDQTGDFLVCQNAAGTEKFVIAASGALNLAAPPSRMVLGTVALASLASNASATVALSGLTTAQAVFIAQTTATTAPTPVVWVSTADKLGYGAPSVACAAQTVAYWAFATV